MTYVIAQPCVDVKDKACVDECPVDCIYEGNRSLYINPNERVDCGACEPVCDRSGAARQGLAEVCGTTPTEPRLIAYGIPRLPISVRLGSA